MYISYCKLSINILWDPHNFENGLKWQEIAKHPIISVRKVFRFKAVIDIVFALLAPHI